jgi:hypothetical protein
MRIGHAYAFDMEEREHDIVVRCPGCGAAVTIRSTRMARVEWESIVGGRYIGWATCAHEDDEDDFAFIQSGKSSATIYYSDSPQRVHQCSRGGDADSGALRR